MRYVLIVVALVVVVGGLGYVKYSQIASLMAMGAEMQKSGPPPEMVSALVAKAESWEGTLSAVGSVAGAKSVALSNDAAGRVRRIRFESGATVKQGQVLVELDSSVERAQLSVLTSRRDLARVKTGRSRALVAENLLPQAQLDNDDAELRTTEAEIAALNAEIDRKVVRAPFAGRLGIRAVNMGQYLNPGTTLTTLEEIGEQYVDFTLPQQLLGSLKENMPVRITLGGTGNSDKPSSATGAADKPSSAADKPNGADKPGADKPNSAEKPNAAAGSASEPNGADSVVPGVIIAIAPALDSATRSIKLRASVPNIEGKLRPGMFVNVTVITPNQGTVVAVPATSVVHAPYGDSVFVLENKEPGSPGAAEQNGKPVKVAKQKFVRLGAARGDFVAIADGVKAGEEVVTAGAFKLRNGSPVVVDNSVQAEAQLHPKPENH